MITSLAIFVLFFKFCLLVDGNFELLDTVNHTFGLFLDILNNLIWLNFIIIVIIFKVAIFIR